ncbi:SAM-dependent methyltransferase [Desulfoscipio geothermicus]|uniref:SAM-dependent methyltransferase n=1 Tax=Desulfoscipio geothermicus TaxID=39060 RepID=UPI003CCBADF9
MPFAKGFFDKIVTIGAIEHILDLPKLFRDCRSILTPEGLMLVHGMSKPWKIYVDERNSPPELRFFVGKFTESPIFPINYDLDNITVASWFRLHPNPPRCYSLHVAE